MHMRDLIKWGMDAFDLCTVFFSQRFLSSSTLLCPGTTGCKCNRGSFDSANHDEAVICFAQDDTSKG
jgi:hypothetical protein